MLSPGMMWAKVLHGRYGCIESFSKCSNVDRRASWWWEDIGWVLQQGNFWLDEKIERCIGDGTTSQFWEDKWIGDLRLLDVFPRLYSFAFDPLSMVGNNGNWEGYSWVCKVTWRRETFVHEVRSVNTLLEMLQGLQIFSSKQDLGDAFVIRMVYSQ
uniref:Uncharacterized protein n=1 Tax=Cajanus cajan TaxID=3821 RepID=A0A151R9E2_CAJCA|nr:hypothetical protein KK1_039555 [Cajanus cajan]